MVYDPSVMVHWSFRIVASDLRRSSACLMLSGSHCDPSGVGMVRGAPETLSQDHNKEFLQDA